MATDQLARTVHDPAGVDATDLEDFDFIDRELSSAYLGLHVGIDLPHGSSLASQIKEVAARKLLELRTLWPVLQLGSIRSLKDRHPER